jgi:ABC-2 type transport system permease protein
MSGTTFAGAAALTRLALRRDRVVLPGWVLGLAALTASFTAMTVSGFDGAEALADETAMMAATPALRMTGLSSGASVGNYALARGYLTLAVLAALMSVFAVVRHTRQNEETGRAELVGAAVAGRYAQLAAAVLVALAANVALVPLVALAMIAGGQPVAGSVAAGAAVAVVGLSFTGVAAVTVQLSPSTRAASGMAGAALGLAFLFSGVGNMLGKVDATGLRVISAWPAWLSPIGWGQQMRPFDRDAWWPLAPGVGLLVSLLVVAAVLASRRDFGRGIVAERLGVGRAGRGLLSPFGLAVRLQRPALVGWAVGMAAFGLLFGAISDQVVAQDPDEWYARMGGTDQMSAAFRTAMLVIVGMALAAYLVQALLRMRAEEADGRLESVLATAVSRVRWMAGHLTAAVVGSIGLILVLAVTMGLAAGDSAGEIGDLCAGALAHLTGPLVLGGAVVAACGLLPRWSGALGWGLLLVAVLLGPMFGPDLGAPGWALDLSPFTHVPKAPAVEVTAGPVLALAIVAGGLGAVGLVAFRRRDLALPT